MLQRLSRHRYSPRHPTDALSRWCRLEAAPSRGVTDGGVCGGVVGRP